MSVLAAANPTGAVMTYVFPLTMFLCVGLWGYFQHSRR
jgi:hypothetical protein